MKKLHIYYVAIALVVLPFISNADDSKNIFANREAITVGAVAAGGAAAGFGVVAATGATTIMIGTSTGIGTAGPIGAGIGALLAARTINYYSYGFAQNPINFLQKN